jgi:hypothetical protein
MLYISLVGALRPIIEAIIKEITALLGDTRLSPKSKNLSQNINFSRSKLSKNKFSQNTSKNRNTL